MPRFSIVCREETGRDLSFDEFINRNALLLGIIEDGEFLLGSSWEPVETRR
jgi:hypothetical protein